ncbi:adenylate/guanylate cyclase domain-containing protein, partial [Streptomyces sp. NPDC002454]
MTVDDTGAGAGRGGAPDPGSDDPGPVPAPARSGDSGRGPGSGTAESTDGDGDDPLALRLEQLILGAERRYTPFQAARSAGVSMELASRFWRAMGFADIGQAKALTEADVLALRRLAGL